ncbi:hypothetical protein PUN28_006663 [Cardiocondyla obscurior]|uniref:Uncharacterized protein n=1 Tax=Cardiocondyla obscurior TaxID=286306 RepID=A0AAW2GAB3_9HYME
MAIPPGTWKDILPKTVLKQCFNNEKSMHASQPSTTSIFRRTRQRKNYARPRAPRAAARSGQLACPLYLPVYHPPRSATLSAVLRTLRGSSPFNLFPPSARQAQRLGAPRPSHVCMPVYNLL